MGIERRGGENLLGRSPPACKKSPQTWGLKVRINVGVTSACNCLQKESPDMGIESVIGHYA